VTLVVDQVVYPRTRTDALAFRVYDDSAGAASVAVSIAVGAGLQVPAFTGGSFQGQFAASSVSGVGSIGSPLLFAIRRTGGWQSGVSYLPKVSVTEATVTPRRPTSIAVGKLVHYYPRSIEAGYPSPTGFVATITDISAWPVLSLHYGSTDVLARLGTWGQGLPGTFDLLDYRHRRHLRIHNTPHAQDFLANLEADPALVVLWRDTYKVDIDLIIQGRYDEIPGQLTLFTATVARFVALGFQVNFGALPIGPAISDPSDGPLVAAATQGSPARYGVPVPGGGYAVGMTSVWFNRTFWQNWANAIDLVWQANKHNIDHWYHSQKEAAFISACYEENCLAAGKTQAELKYAFQPYIDQIGLMELHAIVRPNSVPRDWAFELLVQAGKPGSAWCHEGMNRQSQRRRRNIVDWRKTEAEIDATLALIKQRMPTNSIGIPLKLEQIFRLTGAMDLEDPFTDAHTYGAHEIVDLVESGGRVPQLGKEAWRQLTTRTAAIAGGASQPSANDKLWGVSIGDPFSVHIDPSRSLGTGRGTPNQTGLTSWYRKSNGTSVTTDAIDNIRPLHPEGLMTPPLESNAIRGWLIGGVANTYVTADPANSSVAYASFTNYFEMRLPSVAPAPGVTWGIWCIAAGNAHAANLIWDGTSGQLKLNVRSTGGQDTVTYFASPIPGATYRFVIAYDASQGATGKWWAPAAGWVATSTAKNSTTVSPVIGGAHDMLNRGGQLWGIPGALLPFDSQVEYWKRALTALELTCINTVKFTLTPTVANSTVYSGTVDGVAWTFTSDSSATLAEVLAGIAAAITAVSGATVANTGTAVTVTRDGWLHVTRDDYRFVICERTVDTWPFGYKWD
jgi:hypothetical protein